MELFKKIIIAVFLLFIAMIGFGGAYLLIFILLSALPNPFGSILNVLWITVYFIGVIYVIYVRVFKKPLASSVPPSPETIAKAKRQNLYFNVLFIVAAVFLAAYASAVGYGHYQENRRSMYLEEVKNAENVFVCDKHNGVKKDECISDYLLQNPNSKNDVTIDTCASLSTDSGINDCYFFLAYRLHDPSICAKDTNPNDKILCVNRATSQ